MKDNMRKGFGAIDMLALICIIAILAAVVVPVFSQHKGGGKNPCLSSLKQLATSAIMYCGDNDDLLPRASGWPDLVLPYAKTEAIFHESMDFDGRGYGYAYRIEASDLNANKVADPPTFPIFYDSTDTRRSATGGLDLLPVPGRHHGWDGISFIDGHAKSTNFTPRNGKLAEATEAMLDKNNVHVEITRKP